MAINLTKLSRTDSMLSSSTIINTHIFIINKYSNTRLITKQIQARVPEVVLPQPHAKRSFFKKNGFHSQLGLWSSLGCWWLHGLL